MKINESQAKVLVALLDVGGWASSRQLEIRGAWPASCPVLVRLGLAERQKVGFFELSEWRLTKSGQREAEKLFDR